MCGLVGAFGHIDDQSKSIFRWMLYLDVFRGPHSTGVHVVDEETYEGVTYKELGLPHNVWVANPDAFTSDGLPKGKPILLMGHNRWATKGEVIKENAHPFTFGKLTGCHNGTLPDYDLRKLKENDKFEVDSKVLYRNIELDGVRDVWPKVTGAMALTWWNDDEGALYIARNSQRPLHMWQHANCLYWSSEKWVLNDAARASGVQGTVSIREVPINKLHKFYINDKGFIKEEIESLTPFSLPSYAGGSTTSNVVNIGQKQKSNFAIARISEWVESKYPASQHNIGYFVAKDINDEKQEYIIQMYANSLKESIKRKEEILENSRNGFNTYRIDLTTSWQHNGFTNVNQRQVMLWKGFIPPQRSELGKDKLGTEISYGFFTDIGVIEGCTCCYSPITPSDWHNLDQFVVLKDEEAILCPHCSDEKTVKAAKELLSNKQYDFMANWS